MPAGSRGAAWVMAACTSKAAPSRSRLRLNCSVICVAPIPFVDVIESNPAMVENCRSSGVATADAIVSGFAPGKPAETKMVGKSTLGRSLTPRNRYAMAPNNAIASINRLVAIGRRMKTFDIFTTGLPKNYISALRQDFLATKRHKRPEFFVPSCAFLWLFPFGLRPSG